MDIAKASADIKAGKPVVVTEDFVNAIHELYPREIEKGLIVFDSPDGKTAHLVEWNIDAPIPTQEEAAAAKPKSFAEELADIKARLDKLEVRLNQ